MYGYGTYYLYATIFTNKKKGEDIGKDTVSLRIHTKYAFDCYPLFLLRRSVQQNMK